jgi:hypothetical protein
LSIFLTVFLVKKKKKEGFLKQMGDKENKKDPIFQGKQSFEEKERKHENKKGLNGKKKVNSVTEV